jgi:hypothetical protein
MTGKRRTSSAGCNALTSCRSASASGGFRRARHSVMSVVCGTAKCPRSRCQRGRRWRTAVRGPCARALQRRRPSRAAARSARRSPARRSGTLHATADPRRVMRTHRRTRSALSTADGMAGRVARAWDAGDRLWSVDIEMPDSTSPTAASELCSRLGNSPCLTARDASFDRIDPPGRRAAQSFCPSFLGVGPSLGRARKGLACARAASLHMRCPRSGRIRDTGRDMHAGRRSLLAMRVPFAPSPARRCRSPP